MSNMTRCENGHYYDSAANRRCPDCGVRGLVVQPTRPQAIPVPGVVGAVVGEALAGPVGGLVGRAMGEALGDGHRGGETVPRRAPVERREGVTVAFWQRPRPEEVAAGEEPALDPVVGWLVAIDGPKGVKGRDYRLYSEGNPIGREHHNRLVIKDDAIGRDTHATVTFDPRSADSAYYIQAGGRHMLYLNGSAVLAPQRLNAYDVVEIGHTKLVFVPLCGERFRWDVTGGG
jgi:hypothetical protein